MTSEQADTPYTPAAIYFRDSDCVEYVKSDSFCVYERVDGFLTLIRRPGSGELVGFKLKGFRNRIKKLAPSLVLSDKHFLHLISAIESIYTELGDQIFKDEKRKAAYKEAYQLAANDNVKLEKAELLAA